MVERTIVEEIESLTRSLIAVFRAHPNPLADEPWMRRNVRDALIAVAKFANPDDPTYVKADIEANPEMGAGVSLIGSRQRQRADRVVEVSAGRRMVVADVRDAGTQGGRLAAAVSTESSHPRMKDQRRNLNPTPEAVFAMFHWHEKYAAQGGGTMDFYDQLPPRAKAYCTDAVAAIHRAQPETVKAVPAADGPAPRRCPARSPGGLAKDGRLPRQGKQCGNYEGHDGDHTVLIPTGAPWFPKTKGL